MTPLPGYEAVAGRRSWGIATPAALPWVTDALSRGRKLRDVAEQSLEAFTMEGRGPVYAVPGAGGCWVVRPYRRGGMVAGPVLQDRYLRVGEPRPLREARTSLEVAGRQIPTPPVLAGAVYPAGAFYRADIVTAYIPGSLDLAALVFGDPSRAGAARMRTLVEAGRLIGRMARVGIEHADLNARNVLLAGDEQAPYALVLDLDRCRVREAGRSCEPTGMLRRLERSLRKIGAAERSPLVAAEWDALRAAVESLD